MLQALNRRQAYNPSQFYLLIRTYRSPAGLLQDWAKSTKEEGAIKSNETRLTFMNGTCNAPVLTCHMDGTSYEPFAPAYIQVAACDAGFTDDAECVVSLPWWYRCVVCKPHLGSHWALFEFIESNTESCYRLILRRNRSVTGNHGYSYVDILYGLAWLRRET